MKPWTVFVNILHKDLAYFMVSWHIKVERTVYGCKWESTRHVWKLEGTPVHWNREVEWVARYEAGNILRDQIYWGQGKQDKSGWNMKNGPEGD